MSRFIELHNPTGLPTRNALWGLLKRGLSRGYTSMPWGGGPDYVEGRRQRTAAGGPAEVELCADGSGLEIAWQGRCFGLGVERAQPREPQGLLASLRYFASFVFARH